MKRETPEGKLDKNGKLLENLDSDAATFDFVEKQLLKFGRWYPIATP